MTQDDVSTAAGEAGVAHVFGRELDGQATIEAVQRLDTVEHLAVPSEVAARLDTSYRPSARRSPTV
jgi:hypothetical protein